MRFCAIEDRCPSSDSMRCASSCDRDGVRGAFAGKGADAATEEYTDDGRCRHNRRAAACAAVVQFRMTRTIRDRHELPSSAVRVSQVVALVDWVALMVAVLALRHLLDSLFVIIDLSYQQVTFGRKFDGLFTIRGEWFQSIMGDNV